MMNNIRSFVHSCRNDSKRVGGETFASGDRSRNRTAWGRRLSGMIAGALVGLAAILLAGCSDGGTPGSPAQPQGVEALISGVAIDRQAPGFFEPAMLPTGPDDAPALVQSSILPPDSTHPNGQVELFTTIDGQADTILALVGAPGMNGYFEASYYPDMSAASRSVTPLVFSTGETLHVSLRLVFPNPLTSQGVIESPPLGWMVSNVSSAGKYNPSTGQIYWIPLGPFPETVSYDITAPVDATSPVGFVGTAGATNATMDSFYSEIIGGQQIVTVARSRNAISTAEPVKVSSGKPAARRPVARQRNLPGGRIDLSPNVPIAQFNADLLIVEYDSAGLTKPLAVHIQNGVATASADRP